MNTDRIEFISSYCDRWCERCRFTERCSTYAIEAAVGMTGDVAAGLELATGTPRPAGARGTEPDEAETFTFDISDADLAQARRHEERRRTRVGAHPLAETANAYTMRAMEWLKQHRDRLEGDGDPVLQEALRVVGWDAFFISAKLYRALSGRDRHREYGGDDQVQNDWNGSAKIALISIERSEAAWRVIGGAGVAAAGVLVDSLGALRQHALQEFPRAMAFVRPGFDEPWR